MFEHRSAPIISKQAFASRMLWWGLLSLALILLSLLVGVCGYHYTENLPWLDALLNASMILGGMGEISTLNTDAGKWFASIYAIYCGLFLVMCGGLFLVPVFHRVLHHFHADKEEDDDDEA